MRLILFFLALCINLAYASEPINKHFFDKSLLPTIQVVNKNKQISGSGIILKSFKLSDNKFINYAISCQHIVSPIMTVNTFMYKDYNFFTGQLNHGCCLIEEDKMQDLSIVAFLSTNRLEVAKIGTAYSLKILEQVYAIGCGLEEYPRFTEGKINGLPLIRNNLNDLRTTVPIVPGDSGCALFNQKNEVVGIANSIRKLNSNGISYPIEGISTFKPIDLIFKSFSSKTYGLLENEDNQPEIFADFMWLLETEYGT